MKTLGLTRIIGAAAATAAAVVTLAFAATVGQAARPPAIAWSPATNGTFDYGTVDVGQAVSQTFALTNSGGSATGMLRASLSGSATFSITADACTGTALGPGKSCNVTVHYAPTTAVQSTATLAANGTKPPSNASITLTGTGRSTTGPGDLVLSPGTFEGTDGNGTKNYSYDFGAFATATQTFRVTNQGTVTSNTLSFFFAGPNQSLFALSGDNCTGQALAPGGACEFQLTFTAPAGCNPGDLFDAAVAVEVQTNGSPYIALDLHGSCPP